MSAPVLFATKCFYRHMSQGVLHPRNRKTRALLNQVIRVDHAGEYGAIRIYEGQLAVLGPSPVIEVSESKDLSSHRRC